MIGSKFMKILVALGALFANKIGAIIAENFCRFFSTPDESFWGIDEWVRWQGVDDFNMHRSRRQAGKKTSPTFCIASPQLHIKKTVIVDSCETKKRSTSCQSTFWDRPGATGGHTGAVLPQLTACAPPNENCAPPSGDSAPKKLTGSGLLERKSRSKLVFFVDWHQILWRFWDEDRFLFFTFEDHLFSAGKTAWISDFGRKIPCNLSEDLFFGDHLFSAGKTTWTSDFGRKIPLTFCSSPCLFDPEWDKFLVPQCPSRIHTK